MEVVMRGDHGVLLAAATVFLSGCATGQTRQAVARLQAQVGMLDDRVTQLEHSAVGGASAAAAVETAGGAEETVSIVTQPQQGSAGTQPAAATSSGKPSTQEIQQALKNAGFYQGPLDGKMGPVTTEAVKEFQRIHGLNDDGVVGKQTWAQLGAYEDLSVQSGGADAAAVLK
jgi:murein L,D-transpeptidase YcbB/YkuD